ncbi:general substrate transporter [Aspergillus sergii]|uniref:General substrate transporter n=1 Tax=Aspergillus sergii TaxID=1034303 RepID=A0A5N6XF41_9EURO|nr:general substrate transporter [Aspergillus sergii]
MAELHPVINDGVRHYQISTIWTVTGIAWGAISYAYSASIIGTTLGQPSFLTYMELTAENSAALTGTITGMYHAGGVFGCLLNSYLADRIGRKWTASVAHIILLVSSACLCGSVHVAMFIVFRFFAGLGAYMLYLTTPLWVVELVPPKGRSITAGIIGLFGVVGYILAAYVGVGFHYLQGPSVAQWRSPLALGCAPPLVGLSLMPWLPESPRWLLLKGRTDEAYKIVSKYHRRPGVEHDESADAEFALMREQSHREQNMDRSWVRIATYAPYRKRAILVIILPFIVYTTGNLVITTYAASIFAGLGYDATQSLHFLAGTYLAAVVGNLISLTYVDRVPRNILMACGVMAGCILLAIETGLVAAADSRHGYLAGAAAFLFLFLFTFNLFLEGPSWYYASEVFPTHIRSKGMALNIIGFCATNLLWLEVSPTGFSNIQWKFYLVFISLSFINAFIVYYFFPDTLGRPLEEIAQLFGDSDDTPSSARQGSMGIEKEDEEKVQHMEQVLV